MTGRERWIDRPMAGRRTPVNIRKDVDQNSDSFLRKSHTMAAIRKMIAMYQIPASP
jgi:hypothetical protein